jgi:hypothetical protein
MDDVFIEVKEIDEEAGYLFVDGLTLSKGRHKLWNYEVVKDGPDFKRHVASGKVVVLGPNLNGT